MIWQDIVQNLAHLVYGKPTSAKRKYSEFNLGVWRVVLAHESLVDLPGIKYHEDIMNIIPLLRRACGDLYAISPPMFLFMILAHFWYAVEDALSLYFSSQLLFHVSHIALVCCCSQLIMTD